MKTHRSFGIFLTTFFLATLTYAELPQNYLQLPAKDKQQILWNKTAAKQYQELPPIPAGGWGSVLTKIKSMLTLNETFDHHSDEMPATRGKNKVIHSSGSVAKIFFQANENSPFTGVFQTGAYGIVRLSVAASPESVGSFTPGMGLKLLIDGQQSVNVTVMYSLDGQGANTNFFANNFSNRIPEPKSLTLKILKQWFSLFVDDPLVLSVDHFAAVEADDRKVENPVIPYQLIFKPTTEVQLSANSKNDFRIDLKTIEPGKTMYQVLAKANANDQPFEIGKIILISKLIPSEYGDHQLFFQHRE